MSKNSCIIYAPVFSISGYGAHARSKVKSIIETKQNEWDIKIIPCSWGNTPNNFIEENPQWSWLNNYILQGPLTSQPDYAFFITIPEETQRWGRWNCLITAGIESTACTAEWIQGCNRMDRVWVSSNHAKWVFENTKYEQRDQQGNKTGVLELTTPVDVVFEGGDLDTYGPIKWVD